MLLTGAIADQIYGRLDQQRLLSEEQIGFRKKNLEELMIYFILIGQ